MARGSGSEGKSLNELILALGLITLTFDDGRSGVMYVYPVLQEAQIPANLAINPTNMWDPGDMYLSVVQVQALQGLGWHVVSHGMTHANLASLSPDSLRWELRESQRVLDSLGMPTRTFITPYTYCNELILAEALQVYENIRCGVQAKWSVDTLQRFAHGRLVGIDVSAYHDETLDRTYSFGTEAGRGRLRQVLKKAMSQGKFVDLFLHDVTPADTAAFREFVGMLQEFKANIVTYQELE
ncbi:MAG: hypothetical protein E4H01_10395 [Lysobacterales bacterium]|nr:MAG: hypothetical protein E4H01_10395 [Xanthomonadales bacterium]